MDLLVDAAVAAAGAAGAIPAAAVAVGLAAVVAAPVLVAAALNSTKRLEVRGKHVLVTGGSKGLGKALAAELAVRHGAHVTVVARGQRDLDEAVAEINAAAAEHKRGGKAQGLSCDVTDAESVAACVKRAEDALGPVEWVVACAGGALTGRFLDTPLSGFEAQMRLNYLGSVAPALVVARNMAQREQRGGRIVLVASQAALMGCVGYAAYSPTKFAVRGLGESLRHELLPYGIRVHVAFPGNMKTPGYEHEQRTKPEETKRLEEGEPLQTPEDVARATIDSIRKGEFALYGGNLSGFALGRASAGIAPRSTLLLDVMLAPLLVVIMWFHRAFVLDRVVKSKPKPDPRPPAQQER